MDKWVARPIVALTVLAACADDPARPRPGDPPSADVTGPLNLDDVALGLVSGADVATLSGRSLHVADFDADGIDDLLVTAGSLVPEVHLMHGPIVGERLLADADARVTGVTEGPYGVGDLDADGWRDLVLWDRNLGATVWYGPLYGARDPSTAEILVSPGLMSFGGLASYVTDLDQDGVDDLLVGLPMAILLPAGVMVYLGPFTGMRAADAYDLALVQEEPTERIGGMDASHDLDGDGERDLLVTAASDADPALGGAWVVHEPPTGESPLPVERIDANPSRVIGPTVITGDLDGDGHSELLLHTLDEAVVFLGPFDSTAKTLADAALILPLGEGAPLSVGDGRIAIGVPLPHAVVGLDSGRIDLYEDWESGFREQPDRVLTAGFALNGLGASSAAGDLDGDGDLELVFGAPNAYVSEAWDAGRTYVVDAGSL